MAFKNPIVAGEELILTGLKSDDYVQGVSGWRIGQDGSAQFDGLNILNDTATERLSVAETISLQGEDLATTLEEKPKGVISYDNKWDGTWDSGLATNVETGLIEIATPDLSPSRLYRLHMEFHLVASVGTDHWDLRMRYTNNGTTPTVTSPIFRTHRIGAMSAGTAAASEMVEFHKVFTGNGPMRALLTLQRAFGTGTAYIYLEGDSTRSLVWYVEDMGLYGNATKGGTAVVLRETTGGVTPSPEPPPIIQYGPYYYHSTWTQSFKPDNTRQDAPDSDMWIGSNTAAGGNMYSIAGFDYVAIMARLAGATYVSCKLAFTVNWVYAPDSGLDVRVNSHDYTANPITADPLRVWKNIVARQDNKAAGVTYSVELGETAFNNFKSGAWKGVGFGPGGVGLNEYGTIRGQWSANRPRLSFSYTK